MSYADIMEHINGCVRREREELKIRAAMDHTLACLIGLAFNAPKKLPKTPEKAYPGLFKDGGAGETDWMIIKANMSAIAKAHNQKWEAKNH